MAGYVDNDYASRFAEVASGPDPRAAEIVQSLMNSVVRGNSARETARDRALSVDARLSREASKGDKSLIGYAAGYGTKVEKIRGSLQSDPGSYFAMKRIYDDFKRSSTDDQDGYMEIESLADTGGVKAVEIAEAARKIRTGAFADETVKFGDREVTLRQLFEEDNPLSPFRYDSDVADAYFGGDRFKSKLVGTFVDPGIRSGGANGDPSRVFNIGLLNDAAAWVNSNSDRMRLALGEEGSHILASESLRRNGAIGGVVSSMRGVLEAAEKCGVTAENGASFVRNYMSASDELTRAMFVDPSTGKVENLSPSELRWSSVVGQSAMSALSDRGVDARGMSSDRVRSAATRAAAAVNLARHYGIRLFDEAKNSGINPMEDLKVMFGSFYDNPELTPDTFVTRFQSDLSTLQSRVSVAPVTEVTQRVASGARGYFDGDPSRASGKVLTSSAAGVLGNRIVGAVLRETTSLRNSGKSLGQSIETIALDPESNRRFTGSLVNAMSRSFDGRGGAMLAEQVLVPALKSVLLSREVRPFEATSIVENIVINGTSSGYLSNVPEADRAEIVRAASRWYRTEVREADRFAPQKYGLVTHYMSQYVGMKQQQAIARASRVAQRMEAAMESGGDVNAILRAEMNTGIYYGPTVREAYQDPKNPKNKKYAEAADDDVRKTWTPIRITNPKVASRYVGDISDLRDNPAGEKAVLDSVYRRMYEDQQKAAAAAMRKEAQEDG